MNGFNNNNNNGWNTCHGWNTSNNNNANNSLNMQYFTAIDQQLKTLQQNTYLESIRSNLSNLQNHIMSQGNNNHIHHSGFVNHIHHSRFVTPGAPPLLNNHGFPHHFNNNINNNGHNHGQYHGNGVRPTRPQHDMLGNTIPFGNNLHDNNHFCNNNNLYANQYRNQCKNPTSRRPYIQPNVIHNRNESLHDYVPRPIPLNTSSPNDRTNINYDANTASRRPYVQPNIIHNNNANAPPIPSITSSTEAVLSANERANDNNENHFNDDRANDNNDNDEKNNNNDNNNDDDNINNINNINNDNNNNNEFDAPKWAYKQAKTILKRYNFMILLNDKHVKTRMKEWFKTGNAFYKLNRMNQEVNDQHQLNEFLYNERILLNEQSSSSSDNDNDDERKDQHLSLSQQQNQQRASINLAANTTHAFNANDPPRSSLHQYISSPELPSDTNNRTVLTQQQPIFMRRQSDLNLLRNTDNFQSTTAPNNALSLFSNPIPDRFQWTQLNTEQSCVKISIHLCSFDCPCISSTFSYLSI